MIKDGVLGRIWTDERRFSLKISICASNIRVRVIGMEANKKSFFYTLSYKVH